jgi:hypothetical protein
MYTKTKQSQKIWIYSESTVTITSTVILTTLGHFGKLLTSSILFFASRSKASPIVMTPGVALAGGKGGILKLVYSLGVDGRLEMGRGE